MRQWTPVDKHPNIFSYETKKGKRFGVRISYRNMQGIKSEFSKSGLRSVTDATTVLRNFQADLANGQYDRMSAKQVTLDQVWELFIQMKTETKTWRESTRDSYTNFYTHRLQPALGKKKLADLKRPQIQALFTDLADPELIIKKGTNTTAKGLAKETVASVYTVFMTLINYAVRNDLLDKNRFVGIKIGGRARQKKMVTPLEQTKWMQAARERLTPYAFACVQIIASTGMRRGEALGLRTSSVQFVRNEVNNDEYAVLTLDLQRTATEPLGTRLKTDSSYRRIAVSGPAVESLHFAIDHSNLLRRQTNKPADTPTWLWLNRNGDPIVVTSLEAWFRQTSHKCGIKVTPHMLRHYFATQAIASGQPQIDVMHYLGHSNLQMTADYTRGTDSAALAVSKGFEQKNSELGGTESVQTDRSDGTENDVPTFVPTFRQN